MLNYQWIDRGSDVTVVLLHGFMGSHQTFQHVEMPYNQLMIDLPGHGLSLPMEQQWTFDFIVDAIHALVGQQSIYLYGYSMGGRVALYYALKYQVAGLILESASPGLSSGSERMQRREMDDRRAAELERDYTAFTAAWEVLPLFQTACTVPDERLQQQRAIRLSHQAAGLAKALRDYGTGSQPNLWPKLKAVHCPVLLLTGTLDQKFTAINKQMKALIPNAQHIEIEAGHTIHVEHPDIFDTIGVEFIKEAHHV